MESETEVKVIQVNLKCPDCDVVMKRKRWGGWISGATLFSYICPRCNHTTTSGKDYPYLKYIPIKYYN